MSRFYLALILCLAGATAPTRAESWPSVGELMENHDPVETARLREMLWMTPLGLLVRDYLAAQGDPALITARADRITYRVLSSGPMVQGRLAAIHLMRRDLFEKGRVDATIQNRLNQLDSEIDFRVQTLTDQVTGSFLLHTGVPLAVGVAAGSLPVREQTLAAANSALKRMGPFYSEKWASKMAHSSQELREHFNEGKFFKSWSLIYAWAGFKIAEEAYWKVYSYVKTGSGDHESLLRHLGVFFMQKSTSIEYL